ncbi:MAG: hypothetical protein F4X35_03065 [Alphaproteobacteria bacterium]|nr:hypothetical protein [Alphaproteobacteria bacterium]
MHAPHGPLAPPGWKRSHRGRLWLERAGFTVVLHAPPARWRVGVYGPKGTAPRYLDVAAAVLREAHAARLALAVVARELGPAELPAVPSWMRTPA